MLTLKRCGNKQCYFLELNSGKLVFFSYETPVAFYEGGKWYITDEYFSRTTSAHISSELPSNVETIDEHEFNMRIDGL
jgi:hypothetical protein